MPILKLLSICLLICSISKQGKAQINTGIKYDPKKVPNYLKDYADDYKKNPRVAALKWMKDAKYGMFMHYGVYSQTGKGEWVMWQEKIHVKEYTKLIDTFDPSNFDADAITDLALDAGMKYICITTKHHDSFCLWDTQETDFKSTNAKGNRDLIKDLAIKCNEKGIGLFFYYSYGRDWRHPHGVSLSKGGTEKLRGSYPEYDTPEPTYLRGTKDHDVQKYVSYVNNQVKELLTYYGPIAAIWFDGPPDVQHNFDVFKPYKTYDMIHKLQPQCLVSAKWGLKDPNDKHSFEEDFFAPEVKQYKSYMQSAGKPIEICMNFNTGWAWKAEYRNKGTDFIKESFKVCNYVNSNLLLNVAPMPDGAIHAEDQKALREVGSWLKENGWPKERIDPNGNFRHWREGEAVFSDNEYKPMKYWFEKE